MPKQTFEMLAATISVINTSAASYTIASPSLNYYVITISDGSSGGFLDSATFTNYLALETAPPMDAASFTNP